MMLLARSSRAHYARVPSITSSLCRRRNVFAKSSSRIRLVRSYSEERRNEEPEKRDNQQRIVQLGTLGVGGMWLLSKGKFLLGALKVTKLSTLISMGISTGAYAMFYGWPFAVGMIGLIFVHESGHALAMRHYGVPFSPMVFLPFMGAAVAMKEHPTDAYQEAMIAFAGPVLGTAGAVAAGLAGNAIGSQLLIGLCDFGLMINLFNLLPLGSMDGGRICGAISKYTLIAGLGVGGALIVSGSVSNPIFYLIFGAGGYETYQRFFGSKAGSMPPGYYKITGGQRAALGVGYAGLIAFLIVAMNMNAKRKMPHQSLDVMSRPEILDEFERAHQCAPGEPRVEALANAFVRAAELSVVGIKDLEEQHRMRRALVDSFRENYRTQAIRSGVVAADDAAYANDYERAFFYVETYCTRKEIGYA